MSQLGNQTANLSIWRKFADGFVAFCRAMEMSEAEFQTRRLEMLEQRLNALERVAPNAKTSQD